MITSALASTAFSALIWWVVPIVALLGAFSYVIWVSKFQDKFENETNRSVSKFQTFQESFREIQSVTALPTVQMEADPTDSSNSQDAQERGK